MINMENFAEMIDDHLNAGPFASEFDGFGMEYIERPITKRLHAPGRRPGGPRQAFRPLQTKHRTNATDSDIDIDPSCLDELDDQLLASPIASFLDVCWAEAVEAHESDLGGGSPTLYNATIFTPPKVANNRMLDNYHDLDPLSPDKEKWYEDSDDLGKADIKYEQEPQKLPADTSPPIIRSQPSLALWEPHFTIPNPNDTVHGFPSRPPKNRRKIDLFSHFPARLVKSMT
ncbi:hypothetical protein PILCRDRAFT_464999 [Piloderma croceum F 1598]|uniref:Uncharacterized protein n=1 Tax=Piloderma croceum (strain F 1598) TaxID=765440 RepID=A0A0C3FUC3_PILCF|nr:hypothetical protein PILCRDRAFT_464999 [Piloderma croceum F 1598]